MSSIGHVSLVNTRLPFVWRVDEGYLRYWSALAVSKEAKETLAIFGVSNIKAERSTDYKEKENEEISPIFGIVIQSKEDAEIFSKFFQMIADNWSENT